MLTRVFRCTSALGVVLLAMVIASCTDSPTDLSAPENQAHLRISMTVAGTTVSTLAAEVTASDIPSKLVFNIPIENGIASGSVTVPAGSDRTVTLRAFDIKGIETHRGSKTLSVTAGTNATVSITLLPLTGDQPLTASFGSLTVVLDVREVTVQQGLKRGLTAVVLNAAGHGVAAPVRWATLNPAIATVDTVGVVTGVEGGAGGRVEIVATAHGASGSAWVTVPGDGTDGSVDGTAPKLTGFSYAPMSIDVSAQDATTEVTLSVTDAGAGVDHGSVTFRSPSGTIARSCRVSVPSGTASNEVVLKCSIWVPQHSPAGNWYVSNVVVADKASNRRFISFRDLETAGFPTYLDVVSATPDEVAPTLNGFTFTPDSVNVSAAGQTVQFTIAASDALSGVTHAYVNLRSPSGAQNVGCGATVPASGTTNDGTWTCAATIPMGGESGSWYVSVVSLADRVGNRKTFSEADLQAAGHATKVRVTN